MSESTFELAVLVVVAGGFAWLFWLGTGNIEIDEAKLRDRALNQFRATKAAFPALHVEFDGQRAEILNTRETKYLAVFLASNYVLAVNARMPDGVEYEFKSDSGGNPWVICRSRSDAHAVRAHATF
jgi:hypothetical protein